MQPSQRHTSIEQSAVPRARNPLLQHLVDTYASETNKTAAVWLEFLPHDLDYRPAQKSSTVAEIFRHQLLGERRFFGEFIELSEVPAAAVLPESIEIAAFAERLVHLALPRLQQLADAPDPWYTDERDFFGVPRQRIWIFWRRVLHSAHHRTQLTVYLRLLGRRVISTYGPTADVTWAGADPTLTVEAAEKR